MVDHSLVLDLLLEQARVTVQKYTRLGLKTGEDGNGTSAGGVALKGAE